MREPYCEALAQARAERLDTEGLPSGASDACPPFDELTLALGSSDRQAIDQLVLLAEPYVAGPYAEGSYEVTLPVDDAVLSAVKPEYRESFAARK